MTALDALAYGLLEGATGLLPVSGDAHLALLGRVLPGLDRAHLLLFRLPTLAALLWVLRREVAALFGSRRALLWPLALASGVSLPLAYFLDGKLSGRADSLGFLASGLLAMGLVLLLAERIRPAAREGPWTFDRGIAVGVAHALCGIPGLSRVGLGAAAGILTGRPRIHAAVFSLLASVPLVLFQAALEIRRALLAGESGFWTDRVLHGAYPLGALTAFLASVLALRWLLGHLKHGTFVPFGIYCLALGALALTWSLATAKIPASPTHEPKAGIPGVGPDGDAAPPAHEPAVLRPEGSPPLPAP